MTRVKCNPCFFVSLLGKGETYTMKGKNIGEFEELVLLTVGILHENAYGLSITDELEARLKRKVTISSVHKALVRLEGKGYLRSYTGGATESRGGRAKKLYMLTSSGREELTYSRELRNTMWDAVPKVVWEGGKL